MPRSHQESFPPPIPGESPPVLTVENVMQFRGQIINGLVIAYDAELDRLRDHFPGSGPDLLEAVSSTMDQARDLMQEPVSGAAQYLLQHDLLANHDVELYAGLQAADERSRFGIVPSDVVAAKGQAAHKTGFSLMADWVLLAATLQRASGQHSDYYAPVSQSHNGYIPQYLKAMSLDGRRATLVALDSQRIQDAAMSRHRAQGIIAGASSLAAQRAMTMALPAS